MANIRIDGGLKSVAPDLALGVIEIRNVAVVAGSEQLWDAINKYGQGLRHKIGSMEALNRSPTIEAARRIYKALGKDPSRYRVSAEALLRRLLQGKPLYHVNNVVDINNYISLVSMFPVGSYDLSRIDGDVVFRVGGHNETYRGIGKAEINLEGIPVFTDNSGPFGSPTSDSERTMITAQTTDVVTAIISFGGSEVPLSSMLQSACVFIQTYMPAVSVNSWIVV